MKTYIKVIIGIAIAIVLAVVVVMVIRNRAGNSETGQVIPTSSAQSFVWRYENGKEDLDGLPMTKIFLDVTYQNGKVVEQMIEEVQGSCNAIDPKGDDKDMLNNTTKVQCYAAGFGEQYKITKSDSSYLVLRKHIEEGNPESAPVVFKYEEVSSIPLFQ